MTDTRDRIRKAAREGWRTDRDGIYDGIRAPWGQWIVREHGDYIAIDGASLDVSHDVSQLRELAAQLVAVADAMEDDGQGSDVTTEGPSEHVLDAAPYIKAGMASGKFRANMKAAGIPDLSRLTPNERAFVERALSSESVWVVTRNDHDAQETVAVYADEAAALADVAARDEYDTWGKVDYSAQRHEVKR